MCGIFALLNNRETDIESIKTEFMKGKNRGHMELDLSLQEPFLILLMKYQLFILLLS